MNAERSEQMVCIEVVEVVTDYLERRLSDDERRRLEAHLEICAGCEVYVAQMRQTVTALRGLAEPAAPADLDALLAAFQARHPG